MIINKDCLEALKELPDNSIDSIITDLEKFYKILPEGIILSKRTGKELAFALTHKGYLKARVFCPSLSKHIDKRKPMFLHRIIARKYLPNYSDKLQVNHINGNKTDNRIENLEMVTNQQNAIHGWTLPNKQIRLSKLFRINGKYAKRT